MAFPSSPSGTRMRQRCTVTPREKVLRTSVSASVPSGNCGFTLSVVDFVDRGDLPEDVVGVLVQLRELQVGRLELVRATWNHRGEEQCHDDERERDCSHRRSVASFVSMLT